MSRRFYNVIRSRCGFTVAELLVVVAIIAVLVAVAIPVFGASLAKSQETTCLANRTSLLHECTVEYLTGDFESVEDAFTGVYAARAGEYTCPDGGTFSFKDGAVTCSKHGSSGSFGDKKTMDTLLSALSATSSSYCDSNAATVSDTCEAAKVNQMLAEKGLSLSSLGATTWKYNPAGYLYWTDVDIHDTPVGTTVPCIRYNFNTGTYTIWSTKVSTGSTGSAAGVTYPILDKNWSAVNITGNASTQTYEWALQALKDAQNK